MSANLTALRHDYLAAQERCPHWDYDNPDGAHEPCCRQMNAAEDAYRAARQAKRGAQLPPVPRPHTASASRWPWDRSVAAWYSQPPSGWPATPPAAAVCVCRYTKTTTAHTTPQAPTACTCNPSCCACTVDHSPPAVRLASIHTHTEASSMKTRNQDFIRAAGFEPVPCFSGTYNVEAAVQNYMAGKTHFYDNGSMAFFSCKVRKARCIDDGVILGTICTQAEGFHGGRVYAVNFHDFTGHGLCASLEERTFKTMKQADAYFWERANAMDGRAIMLDAIRRERDDARRKAKRLTDFMRNKKRAFSERAKA